MGRHKQTPYICLRCAFLTHHKGDISRHLSKKLECHPKISNIHLTPAIKEQVLNRHVIGGSMNENNINDTNKGQAIQEEKTKHDELNQKIKNGGYVYIIQEREFVNNGSSVYKIGKLKTLKIGCQRIQSKAY